MSLELRLGDCLDPVTGLASLADRSVDVICTDPPYSEHVHSRSRRGDTGFTEKQSSRKATFNRNRDLGFESLTQDVMEAAADQFARLARRWVLVFCDVESSHLWAGALILRDASDGTAAVPTQSGRSRSSLSAEPVNRAFTRHRSHSVSWRSWCSCSQIPAN